MMGGRSVRSASLRWIGRSEAEVRADPEGVLDPAGEGGERRVALDERRAVDLIDRRVRQIAGGEAQRDVLREPLGDARVQRPEALLVDRGDVVELGGCRPRRACLPAPCRTGRTASACPRCRRSRRGCRGTRARWSRPACCRRRAVAAANSSSCACGKVTSESMNVALAPTAKPLEQVGRRGSSSWRASNSKPLRLPLGVVHRRREAEAHDALDVLDRVLDVLEEVGRTGTCRRRACSRRAGRSSSAGRFEVRVADEDRRTEELLLEDGDELLERLARDVRLQGRGP